MRRNRSLILGLVALAGLAAIAGVAGSRNRPTSSADVRPSTFLTNPNGAQAYSDALARLGITIIKERQHRPAAWNADSGHVGLVAVLGPTLGVSGSQEIGFLALRDQGASLLVAGGDGRLARCLGYRLNRLDDSAQVTGSTPRPAWVEAVLVPTSDSVVVDSSGVFALEARRCTVRPDPVVDTLVTTATGALVAVRLHWPGATGEAIVVADVDLFRNQTLRDTDIGPTVLGWVVDRYDRVWFPEYLHGYLSGGSLLGWTLRWSRQSPWGWAAWHLALVGLVALAFAMVRFGPPVPLADRRRRSVGEHVDALARALEAAGGHRVALGLIIGGLRRRLTPGARPRDPWQPWLATLGRTAKNPRIGRLAGTLSLLDRDKPSQADVLSAANLAEDLWTEMRS